MSPSTTLSVLAFASAVLAVPYHGHGHARHHRPSGAVSAAPWGAINGTGIYGSGTGFATGTAGPSNYAPPPVGPATGSESATTYVSASTYYNAAPGTICTSDVTVTSKTQVYVTVTVPASQASAASSSSSVESSSAVTSSSSQPSTIAVTSTVTIPSASAASSSSEMAPVQTSSSSIAVYSTLSTSSSSVYSTSWTSSSSSTAYASSSTVLTLSAVNAGLSVYSSTSSTMTSTSSAAASSTSAASTSTGKRGVAYNDASLTDCFLDKPAVSWAYNWASSSSGLNSAFNYIPTLWGPTSDFTDSWDTNAAAAIKAGSTHLFSFNEPDLSSQSNLTPEEAATAYQTYMEPYAGQAKLCAPSVTNGGGSMGLTWLSEFLTACSSCTIDCVNIHWYDSASNTDYFKEHIENATSIADGKDVFVSEFGATGTDDEISTFLQDVMPWMDEQSGVAGYAYFMVATGLLVSGTEPSSYGSVYASS